ncbi:MAG TPA: filamentous hemagglutinin N-terminal domain-containing protein, partial [Chromatiales bacterium]|nr:filamentous hemagglutinin N-terminal domain-containing protein [Chromatiales bacterium]
MGREARTMNRIYRLVYSGARGQWVPAPEHARARRKGRGPRAAAAAALAAALAPAAQAAPGIVADPNAAPGERPQVHRTASGLPQVDIAAPSPAGVSRNAYARFDVAAPGAILNNARTDVRTRLAGWIQGNPNLAGGTARIILNEVRSGDPSELGGYLEVAGDRAQVVVANPAGITCDGCGFINASRATLTTGTPVVEEGRLAGYRVVGGTVRIEGAGLDAREADHTALVARAVEVRAGVWARELTVAAGAGAYDAGGARTGAAPGAGGAPAFAIDVAALGGMYAGKIRLIV